MHESDRTANLLGATALTLTDLLLAGATGAGKLSASAAAALVVLANAPGISVTELGRRVGLTQSAAARMVDSLEADGLVKRAKTTGRWVTVRPTAAGKRATGRLLAGRGGPLTDAVAGLGDEDRAELARLLGLVLTNLYGKVGDSELMCRLCDRAACTSTGCCPVGAAERARRAE